MPEPATTGPVAALRLFSGIVGDAHVLTDPAVTEGYLTDWTGRYRGAALAVVRPGSTAETARVVACAADAGLAVCPQGGNTGLVGGGVPPAATDRDGSRPAIVLSTTRLNGVGEVDRAGRTVGVGAGVTLARVQRAAADAGLAFGVDLAARDSATIGGMVATNAGGVQVMRHGAMRAQVLGVEAVLASGQVLRRWQPLRKDNVGYDLPGLLAGSEGTLAVLTAVLLRLVGRPRRTAVALVGVGDPAGALATVDAVADAGLIVQSAELMTAAGLRLVAAYGHRSPFAVTPPAAVLIEVADAGAEVLAEAVAAAGAHEAAIDAGPARELWALREAHTESIARDSSSPVLKLDVTVPLPAVGELIDRVDALAGERGVRHVPFGHVADGNIHVNLLDVPTGEAHALTDRVLRAVADLGGSISAEHGVGRAKAEWLGLGRSPVDRATMAAVKRAFDPARLFNPGVLGL